eukprot:UN25044
MSLLALTKFAQMLVLSPFYCRNNGNLCGFFRYKFSNRQFFFIFTEKILIFR